MVCIFGRVLTIPTFSNLSDLRYRLLPVLMFTTMLYRPLICSLRAGYMNLVGTHEPCSQTKVVGQVKQVL